MSVIIRLQGLPWSANAMDIRHYFQALSIPEGGVHIVGGELGDAFIAFGSDEDARQAMMRNDGKIKDSRAKLFLSSRAEMQKVIEMARSQPVSPQVAVSTNPQIVNPPINQEVPPNQGRWSPRDSNRRRERSRSRDRDRGRDRRRNRSNSRSRSPRKRDKDKDRDNKRKDDRGRRGGGDDRNKRDEPRKRDNARGGDKMSDGKRDQMEPMAGMMMPNGGNMMPMSHGPFGDRMGHPHQRFGGPPGEMMGPEWQNRPWGERSEGMVPPPMRQPMNKKEWDGPLPEPFNYGGRSRWGREPGMASGGNGGDPFRLDRPNEVPPRDGFMYDDGGPDSFAMQGRRGREPFGGAAGRGRMMGEMGDGGRGPVGPPIGRQGNFEQRPPRGDGFSGGGGEMRMVSMDRRPSGGDSFNSNANSGQDTSMDRRGRGGGDYSNENKDMSNDRRQVESTNNAMVGRVGNFRRSSNEKFVPDVGQRRSFDDESRGMDYRGNHGGPNGRPAVNPGSRFDNYPPRMQSGTCVEAVGMHQDATRADVHDFFRGLVITPDCIKLFPDVRGLKSTSVVIRFASEADREEALKRSGQYVGSRCVEVFPCSESYFDKMASSRYSSSSKSNIETEYTTCVLIRGLPFNFKEDEIVDLFEGMKVVSVLMERDRAGDITGNGFIEFDSVIDAKQAANSKKKIGHKYLELSLVGRERMTAAKNVSEGKKESHVTTTDTERPRSPTTDCSLIQGLPYNATDRDIVDFFSTVSIMPVTIHIMLNKSGQPSGDAFCEFKSVQECEQALRRNKQCMGSRLIYVKSVSRKEMLDALGIVVPPGGSGPMNSSRLDRPPMRTSMDERGGNEHCPPERGPRMPDRVMNDRVPLLDHPNDWSARGREGGLTRELMGFGKPGCVVGAKNIPYRASIDDMLNFFRDYDLDKESIIRRYNEKGQPTGEARIAFRNPTDAQKAVRELNQQLVGGRPCSLFFV